MFGWMSPPTPVDGFSRDRLGKTWNWGTDTNDLAYVPKREEAKLKKKLAKAKKIAFKPLKKRPGKKR